MSDAETLKRGAAERAVEFVEDGMVVGLGTGSTARHVVDVIAERRERGELGSIVGIPTSKATRDHARARGVPLTDFGEISSCDLTIDGADEVGPGLDLIKGLGGALLWEKIVACASDRLVIVADDSKLVGRLGEKAPVPVEVVPFGWTLQERFLEELGAVARVRRGADGEPFVTDGGNYVIDCRYEGGIDDPQLLEAELRERVGIIESGLFLRMASQAVISGTDGVRILERDHG
ncbi:MAG TPA: ribose-5-phosphate isomerase RpiA [Longimicrobiales bacterium]|nr:ribose-5-phosphate isomerase RpiA [Longimicrobiales bacterium]